MNHGLIDLRGKRLIHQSGGTACRTAYAVTQRGAVKLFLRTMLRLDAPVDLIIQAMVEHNELAEHALVPTPMAQWEYQNRIAMESRGAKLDITGAKGEDGNIDLEGEPDISRWDETVAANNVGRQGRYHYATFTGIALERAWARRFR